MEKVLAIGSHPDDIEIGCSGTLLKLKEEGHEVQMLVMTDGRAGSIDQSPTELASIRQAEARAAAKELGVTNIYFFELPDGLTSYSRDDKLRLIKLIRTIRPGVIFTHGACDKSLDHQIIHQLTLAAVFSSSGPWFQESGGEPHSVEKIYGYEVWNPINGPQLAVDISKYMDQKLRALSKHKSQIEHFDYMSAVKGLNLYRASMAQNGTYAEAFEVLYQSSL